MSQVTVDRSVGRPRIPGPIGANILVINIPSDWDECRLVQVFVRFGFILSAAFAKDSDGRKLGFAFVSFSRKSSAEMAVKSMDDVKVSEDTRIGVCFNIVIPTAVEVAMAAAVLRQADIGDLGDSPQKRKVEGPGRTVMIRPVPGHWSLADLRWKFEVLGKVVAARIYVGAVGDYAMLTYQDSHSADAAVQVYHRMVPGQHMCLLEPSPCFYVTKSGQSYNLYDSDCWNDGRYVVKMAMENVQNEPDAFPTVPFRDHLSLAESGERLPPFPELPGSLRREGLVYIESDMSKEEVGRRLSEFGTIGKVENLGKGKFHVSFSDYFMVVNCLQALRTQVDKSIYVRDDTVADAADRANAVKQNILAAEACVTDVKQKRSQEAWRIDKLPHIPEFSNVVMRGAEGIVLFPLPPKISESEISAKIAEFGAIDVITVICVKDYAVCMAKMASAGAAQAVCSALDGECTWGKNVSCSLSRRGFKLGNDLNVEEGWVCANLREVELREGEFVYAGAFESTNGSSLSTEEQWTIL